MSRARRRSRRARSDGGSGQGVTRTWPDLGTDRANRTAGDAAWFRLCELHDRFADYGRRAVFALVLRTASGESGPANQAELAALKVGLVLVAEYLRTSRRTGHGAAAHTSAARS